jgi:putative phage-type endonuclease
MSKNNSSELAEHLGMARREGILENNSSEWHELRKTGIGGSDVSAIAGVNPWTSAFTLWAKKTGRIDDSFVPSEAAEWGTRLEPIVLDKFEEEFPDLKIHRDVGTWRNNERRYQIANPDAIWEKDGEFGIVEIKTARYEDDWADGVPAYYRTQVLWYAQTFGFKTKIYVVALFSGSKFRVFEVDPAQLEFETESNLAAVEKFLPYLEQDKQPDYDGAASTLATVRELHPEINPDLEVELGELYESYQASQLIADEANSRANEWKSRVLGALGNAKRGTYQGQPVVSRQSRNGGIPYLVNKRG